MWKKLRKRYFDLTTEGQRVRVRRYLSLNFRGAQHAVFRALFGSNLHALAAAYGTDKWTQHNYIIHYEKYFRVLRARRVTLLEIGIGGYEDPESGGGSLRMWRTYFPRGRIYGIDINDKRAHDERRIRTFRGSQADEAFLARVIAETGDPDIIIDDGSHRCDHVIRTFTSLFPRLKESGYYVVEDTQTSYWEEYGGSSTDLDRAGTTMGFFKALTDGLNHEEIRGTSRMRTGFENSISEIHFFHNMIVIRKGMNEELSSMSGHDREGHRRLQEGGAVEVRAAHSPVA